MVNSICPDPPEHRGGAICTGDKQRLSSPWVTEEDPEEHPAGGLGQLSLALYRHTGCVLVLSSVTARI